MKKLILLFFALFAFIAVQETQAKGVIIYNTGPNFETVVKLPDSIRIGGTHVNLGIAYDQFGLFWCPVWNYSDPQYILVSDNEKDGWNIDDEYLTELKSELNLELAASPEPSLWNKIGIKPVIVLLIGFVIWGYLPFNRKKGEEA